MIDTEDFSLFIKWKVFLIFKEVRREDERK